MSNELITQAKNEITPLSEAVTALVVKDDDSRASAVELAKDIKAAKEAVELKYHFKENTKKAHATHKAAKDTENSVFNPIDDLERKIKSKVTDYDRGVAIEAQRKASEAEAKRREAERKEREKLEEKARKAEESGKTEKAEALREQAEVVTAAPSFTEPPPETKKLVWKAKISNPLLACQSVGNGLLPFSIVEFKQAELNSIGKQHDGKKQIPGVEFYQDVNSRI